MAEKVSYYATGRRKNSVAKVRLVPGEGKITVNQKDHKIYFHREALTTMIIEPLKLTNTDTSYDVRSRAVARVFIIFIDNPSCFPAEVTVKQSPNHITRFTYD